MISLINAVDKTVEYAGNIPVLTKSFPCHMFISEILFENFCMLFYPVPHYLLGKFTMLCRGYH